MFERIRHLDYLKEDRSNMFTLSEDMILSDWEKCTQKGVDKNIGKVLDVLVREKLTESLVENQDLIRVARPILLHYYNHMSHKRALFILCSSKGHVVNFISDSEVIQTCIEVGVRLGASFRAESAGTNAISLAMLYRRPVILYGNQHYCCLFKTWNCFAIPLVQQNSQVFGYLGLAMHHEDDLGQYTLLLQAMGEVIQERMAANWQGIDNHVMISPKVSNQTSSFPGKRLLLEGKKSDVLVSKSVFYGILLSNEKYRFTVREVEVLFEKYNSKHQGYNTTAKKLNISKQTLKVHLKNIYNKLGVNSLKECMNTIKEDLIDELS